MEWSLSLLQYQLHGNSTTPPPPPQTTFFPHWTQTFANLLAWSKNFTVQGLEHKPPNIPGLTPLASPCWLQDASSHLPRDCGEAEQRWASAHRPSPPNHVTVWWHQSLFLASPAYCRRSRDWPPQAFTWLSSGAQAKASCLPAAPAQGLSSQQLKPAGYIEHGPREPGEWLIGCEGWSCATAQAWIIPLPSNRHVCEESKNHVGSGGIYWDEEKFIEISDLNHLNLSRT